MTNFWGEKRKLEQKSYISNFRAEKKVRAEGKKVTSRAELGHFNFRAENELDFFF